MKKDKKVISRKCLPTNIPLFQTATIYLLLDRFNASDFVCGVVWSLWALILVAALVSVWNETQSTIGNFGE